MDDLKKATDLMNQFRKGVAYFKDQFLFDAPPPPIRRQLILFEREVMDPMDKIFARLLPAERLIVENNSKI